VLTWRHYIDSYTWFGEFVVSNDIFCYVSSLWYQ